MKKLLSLLLVLIMCVSLFPVSVLADDGELPDEPAVVEPAPEEEEPAAAEPAPEEEEPPAEPEAEPASGEEPDADIEGAGNGNFLSKDNFPDPAFRDYLKQFDKGNDKLTPEKAAQIEELSMSGLGIENLSGIAYFTGLKRLDVSGNALGVLKLFNNKGLEELYCGSNRLEELELTGFTSLKALDCSCNKLTVLNLSGCTQLAKLDCSCNKLSSLDVAATALPNLTALYADCNMLEYIDLNAANGGNYTILDQKCPAHAAAYRLADGTYLAEWTVNQAFNAGYETFIRENPAVLVVLDGEAGARVENFNNRFFSRLSSLDDVEICVYVPVCGGSFTTPLSRSVEFTLIDSSLSADRDYAVAYVGDTVDFNISCPEPVGCYKAGAEEMTFAAAVSSGNGSCSLSGNTVHVSAAEAGTVEVQTGWFKDNKPVEVKTVRADFVDSTVTGQLESLRVRLGEPSVAVELFRTDYQKLSLYLELPDLGARVLEVIDQHDIPAPAALGCSVKSAEFTDAAANELFELIVRDDRTLIIKPRYDNINSLSGDTALLKAVPAAISTAVAVTVECNGTTKQLTTDGAVKLTVKKTTVPPLKAAAVKLNSNDKTRLFSVVFSGGTVLGTELVQKPDWVEADNTQAAPRLRFNGKYGEKYTGTVDFKVMTEGWAVYRTVSVKVTAAPVQPKVTFNKKTVSLLASNDAQGLDAAFVTYKISPAEFCDLSEYHISTDVMEGLNPYRKLDVSISSNSDGTGTVRLIMLEDDGANHSLKVNVTVSGAFGKKTYSFAVKTLSASASAKNAPSVTAKKSGAVDLSVYGSAVTLKLTAKNINPEVLTKLLRDGRTTKKIVSSLGTDVTGKFRIEWDYDTVTAKIYTLSPDELSADVQYSLVIENVFSPSYTFSANIPFTVKKSDPAKVIPAVTLKAKGKLDLVTGKLPDFTITLKNFNETNSYKIKNYCRIDIYRVFNAATGETCRELLYSDYPVKNANGSFSLPYFKVNEDEHDPVNPKDKLTAEAVLRNVDLSTGAVSGTEVFRSKELKLSISVPTYKYAPAKQYELRGTDRYGEVVLTGLDAVLPDGGRISKITLDAASSLLFDAEAADYGTGGTEIKIGWLNNLLPADPAAVPVGKAKTVTLSVWINGSEVYSAKANMTIKVKVLVK